jgi:hypothetical protein
MHSGTAEEDKAYAKGIEKGRFLEAGYIVTLLQAELTRIKRLRFDSEEGPHIIQGLYGVEKAIDILDNRCTELRERNGWN